MEWPHADQPMKESHEEKKFIEFTYSDSRCFRNGTSSSSIISFPTGLSSEFHYVTWFSGFYWVFILF